MEIKEHGLYVVSDRYFEDFPSEHWMWNKGQNRPHYYAIHGKDGLMWMIPLSSKVENYKTKIEREEARRGIGKCLMYYIGYAAGQEQAFIISGMFPITEEYIVKPYTKKTIAVTVGSSKMNRELYDKAKNYLRVLELHKMKDLNNVLEIREKLKEQ